MKAWWLAAVLVPLAIAPASARTIRNVEGHFDPERSRTIRLELAPGDIHVEPSKDGHVHIWLDVRCENDAWDDCEGRAQKIRLESAAEGEVFRVEVIGMRNQDNRGLNVNARVQVPADRAFDLVETGEEAVGSDALAVDRLRVLALEVLPAELDRIEPELLRDLI